VRSRGTSFALHCNNILDEICDAAWREDGEEKREPVEDDQELVKEVLSIEDQFRGKHRCGGVISSGIAHIVGRP
jgi:hypothetical protein